ncbi:DNA-binding transcriptional regulator, GntR family [Kaistia soli DSM 19436]|uniref:DNA-binding transcriptional regulator, GntR family n=1 Tax=Kaistia soli DSM 19436 TaxID=1122133 RepID=A0A1M4ZV06_9HYPH|nr:GntR family transcriptional regulator [Kaistia soli]SHF21572.1 DNA-binding transcriptional regulator, GntR family [Kaistia soli DSM 19436]
MQRNGSTASSGRGGRVYAVLQQAIVDQALPPGTKLPEDSIGAQFGVSRTIVRAALQRLAADGLVDMQVKRTATVARPSLEEARSVFEVRRCLEREVARLVAEKWNDGFATSLAAHLSEEQQAAHGGDSKATIRLAAEFHVKLAGMSGNPLLARYVAEVVSRCSLILSVFGRPHQSECAIEEHRAIIEALAAGDAARAATSMEHHVALVERRGVGGEAPAEPDIGEILARYLPLAPIASV